MKNAEGNKQYLKVKAQAEKVLENNLYEVTLNGKKYRRTVPSKEFYVHQWNWDSATHAMGLIHVDEQRAYEELLALVSGQWTNGMIAQITFNPKETKYFPGPQFWGTEKFATGEIVTSGITQPPLLAISVNYLWKKAKDRKKVQEFVKQILPAVIKYHYFLKNYHDPENSGLVSAVHPWECGEDNSPRWDLPLEKIKLDEIPDKVKILVNKYRSDDKLGDASHRPGMDDYYRYMYLVQLYQDWDWDYHTIVKESPFLVKDVLFNSIWCKANESLAELLSDSGSQDQAKIFADYAEQTRLALRKLWDPETQIFTDLDVAQGKSVRIKENSVANFTTLLAGVPEDGQLDVLLDKLTDPAQFWPAYPVPTTALSDGKFSLTKYWRGPTWPINDFLIIEGLSRYRNNPRCRKIFADLLDKTLEMITKNGFFEYFDPTNGLARPGKEIDASLGFGSFSWTAAIFLYLMAKKGD